MTESSGSSRLLGELARRGHGLAHGGRSPRASPSSRTSTGVRGEHPAVDLQHVGQRRERLAGGHRVERVGQGDGQQAAGRRGGARRAASIAARPGRRRRAAAPPAWARWPGRSGAPRSKAACVGRVGSDGQLAPRGALGRARATSRVGVDAHHLVPAARQVERHPAGAAPEVEHRAAGARRPARARAEVGRVGRALHVVPGGGWPGPRSRHVARRSGSATGRRARGPAPAGHPEDDAANARSCSTQRGEARVDLLDVVARHHRPALGAPAAQPLAALGRAPVGPHAAAERRDPRRSRPRDRSCAPARSSPSSSARRRAGPRPLTDGGRVGLDVDERHVDRRPRAVARGEVHLVARDGAHVVGGHAPHAAGSPAAAPGARRASSTSERSRRRGRVSPPTARPGRAGRAASRSSSSAV